MMRLYHIVVNPDDRRKQNTGENDDSPYFF